MQTPVKADMHEGTPPVESQNSNGYDSVYEFMLAYQPVIFTILCILVFEFFSNFGPSLLRGVESIARILWNITVYLTPPQIIDVLESSQGMTESRYISENMSTGLLSGFQAKDAAMQRALGFGNQDDDTIHLSSSPSSPTSPSVRRSSSSFSSILSPARSLLLGAGGRGPRNHLPPGLGNWDNSCYQNSIIQGLASLRSFKEFLDNNVYSLEGRGSFATHESLRDILERLNSPSNSDQRLWMPAALKSMSSWQQQDAQEYFSKLLELIDREVLQASKKQTSNLGLKLAGPGEHIIGATSDLANTGKQGQLAVEKNSFCSPLEGLLAQRVGCMRCGYTEGLSLTQFNCITAPLDVNRACSIRDCLDQYMDLETIEGVMCAKCTLLRAREQLQNLLQQVEGDKAVEKSPESSNASEMLKLSVRSRLQSIEEALGEEDFADKTLSEKCHITPKNRVSTTKSRQSVIARAPQCLAIHVNRSLFDEYTGMLRKNYAEVRFPMVLDLSEWCLGSRSGGQVGAEEWNTNPQKSMLSRSSDTVVDTGDQLYELRALITHYGRHENGHYICYRKYPTDAFPAEVPEAVLRADGDKDRTERWFRLSDDDVQMVSEQHVLSQGGGFMLLYESVSTAKYSNGHAAEK